MSSVHVAPSVDVHRSRAGEPVAAPPAKNKVSPSARTAAEYLAENAAADVSDTQVTPESEEAHTSPIDPSLVAEPEAGSNPASTTSRPLGNSTALCANRGGK